MRVMVTGATGLVGAHIQAGLSQTPGISPVGLTRQSVTDLAGDKVCAQLLNLGTFDAIVHCAANIPSATVSSLQAAEKNKCIDNNIFCYASQQLIPLIFISSVSVYTEYGSNRTLTEASPTLDTPRNNPYAFGKVESEQLYQQLPSCAIFRISSPYGVGQKNRNVLSLFVEKVASGQDIAYLGHGSRTQDFIHAQDIARAVIQGLMLHQTGIYNIVSGQPVSMKELAEMAAGLSGECPVRVIANPQEDPQESFRAIFHNTRAKETLKWQPCISLEEGLHQLYESYLL